MTIGRVVAVLSLLAAMHAVLESRIAAREYWASVGLATDGMNSDLAPGSGPPTLETVGRTAQAEARDSDSAWLDRVSDAIAEQEYHASENPEGLQAPNRAQNLRTYFDAQGIRVHDRTAPDRTELLGLTLDRVGRPGELAAVAPGQEVVSDANRIEIRRPGLVEWFVNGPEGLEQGFTIAERPGGEGKLRIELALKGATAKGGGEQLIFETEAGRKLAYGQLAAWDAWGETLPAEIVLAGPTQLALVVDDVGARYPITIDPLLTGAADSRLEGNLPGINLGVSAASAGDVNGDGFDDVIVGAHRWDDGQPNEGAAFVFLGGPGGIADAGVESAQTRLQSNQPGAFLGSSVASAGDVNGDGYADVIVGAPNWESDSATQDQEGAAFVFLGSSSGIADGNPLTAHARIESDQSAALLGNSVASAGDVNGDGFADVIVGAYRYNSPDGDEGAAFIFLGSASGVAHGNPLTAHAQLESDQSGAQLGNAVASAGDVNGDGYTDVIVGAPNWESDIDPQDGEGAAFVFLGSASGVADGNPATAHAQLESNQGLASLGRAVASAGDVNGDGFADVIVGAPGSRFPQFDEGAAFVFIGSASGIADGNPLTAHAQLESDQTSAQLGFSVASAGDVNGDGYGDLIVGAPSYDGDITGQSLEGAFFVFPGGASGIADGNPLTAIARIESDQIAAQLGNSVASAGDVNGDGFSDVIIGALTYESVSAHADEGTAFVYLGGATGIVDGSPANPASRLESNVIGVELGTSVASAGDVNADGYSDVIVGAPNFDSGSGAGEGAAFIFHGSAAGIPNGIPISAATQLECNQPFALFGQSVAAAGDVNGDGYGDVIVGAPFWESIAPQSLEGAAFVFLGSATGVADANPVTAHAQFESDQSTALLGESVASAGDVDGDGYADVIVGARLYDNGAGQNDEGAAFVFVGSASGMTSGNPASAHAQFESDQASGNLGTSVASAGDVNGDGYADVIVGAPEYDFPQSGEGAAFLFLGSANGLADGNPVNAHARLEGDQTNAKLGAAVASAGDVNGDGYADVIAGAPFYDSPLVDEGAAFVFLGGATGVVNGNPTTADTRLESDQGSTSMGQSVASAGDVNGDGYADVIVGAPAYDETPSFGNSGAALVFLGSAGGVANGNAGSASARIGSLQIDAQMGTSVASAGDVNGDGYADVIAGARLYDGPQQNEGIALVFEGGGNRDGRPVLARQQRSDGSAIAVQSWGGSLAGGGFRVELRANHPNGSGRVRAQIEACAPGLRFGDVACRVEKSSGWLLANALAPDILISHEFTTLPGDTLYRWRARVLHAEATGPLPANPGHGPWRRLGAQALEADIRVPEPNGLISLVAGGGLVAALARRRRMFRPRAEDDVADPTATASHPGCRETMKRCHFHGRAPGAASWMGDSMNARQRLTSSRVLPALAGLALFAASNSSAASRPADADPALRASLESQVAAREYWASEQNGGLQSPNRAQGLRTYYEPSGIHFHDLTAAGSALLVDLRLIGLGREEQIQFVGPARLSSEKASVEIRQSGITEWYENRPGGLEQGFTLAERPKGDGALRLKLEVRGAELSQRGDTLVMAASAGRKLSYGKLAVLDPKGRKPDARFDGVGGNRFAIAVEDASARYPIVVDPLLSDTADTQLQSNHPGRRLGISVALAGDVNGDGFGDVIVGADRYDDGDSDEGAAFSFIGSPDGIADGGAASAQTQPRTGPPAGQLT